MRSKWWFVAPMCAFVLGVAAAPITAASAQTTTTLNLLANGDSNIEQLWTNVLIPQYEKSHPGISIHLIFDDAGAAAEPVYARMAASIKAGKPDPVDVTDSANFAEENAELAGMYVKLNAKNLPNIKLTDPADVAANLDEAAPWRGSQVVLAYNSTTVKNPPTTLAQLISWIQANPGKFDYCDPADGGSGDAFVQAVLESGLSAREIAAFKNPNVYNPKLESEWTANLTLLASLGKDIYRGGYYPTSDTAVLNLLAQGAIQMGTIWSDQGLSSLKAGQLPKTVKLIQLKPAPLYGSPVGMSVPINSAHIPQALAFVNWVLEPAQQATIMTTIGGFPGIEWQYAPASLKAKFASLEAPYDPPMADKYVSDIFVDWQKVVGGASTKG